ncbi:SRPBCC domain-containing protein [Microlunatus soli]|uniref:Uncharacterized conserved protein YndB, AHSA1/START domain n=1 Tax=Microlunatus soli TaxID=630515 RepID=A0A1H1UDV0_9ACTN|nr:SRPBCC domain-containing protein [Microlunatus soli]SDS70633.1 Uncharacterized conserved protein YndB, AHSA1/START domain [Microlunatus soli]
MTKETATDSRTLGSLRAADGHGVVRIEERFQTDAADLWSAITDPRRLARWYGEVDGDLRVGGEYRVFLAGPGLHGAGRIEVCDAPHRLQVVSTETEESWRPGDGGLTFDESIEAVLTGDGDGTTLIIEAHGMPLDKIAFYGVGWQLHAEHLRSYLADEEPDDEEARWNDLVPSYQRLAADLH